jgi:hypothetical protein
MRGTLRRFFGSDLWVLLVILVLAVLAYGPVLMPVLSGW